MKVQHILLAAAAVLSFSCSALFGQERYDHLVREDFFAGFAGNAEALERGMRKTEATLKENPNHAAALVWHGAGLFGQSSAYFRKQDFAKGMELMNRGIAEMNRAVELEPENIGVRVPRAAVLASGARNMPPQMAKPLFDAVLKDYESVYARQKDALAQMGTHPRGELLFGLADIYSRIGNNEKAEFFFAQLQKLMPDTPYARRADEWFTTRQPLPVAKTQCIGCHTGK